MGSEDTNSCPNEVTREIICIDKREGYPIIVVAHLEDMKEIDIIVNSTDKSLNLWYGGQISNTISRIGGQEIQDELNRSYPNGIKPGKVAVTQGYNLPYKFVCHCSLQNISQRLSHHQLRETVRECLLTAQNQNPSSTIAFPVIGTGCMNYHPRVLRTIYTTILEFMINNPNSLKDAYIIVHPGNKDLIDYLAKIDPIKEYERLSYKVDIPASWSDAIRIKLDKDDSEYQFVQKKFADSIGKKFKIIKIERIQNKRLFVAYSRYKAHLPKSLPTKKREDLYVWHGTNEDSINSITQYGFDWRLVKTAAYGQGCYFAVNASYSNQDEYAAPNSRGEKHMFLATIAIGEYKVGDYRIDEKNIESNIQATVNNKDNPTIYITYDDDQMYPAYLIVYQLTRDSFCPIL